MLLLPTCCSFAQMYSVHVRDLSDGYNLLFGTGCVSNDNL